MARSHHGYPPNGQPQFQHSKTSGPPMLFTKSNFDSSLLIRFFTIAMSANLLLKHGQITPMDIEDANQGTLEWSRHYPQ